MKEIRIMRQAEEVAGEVSNLIAAHSAESSPFKGSVISNVEHNLANAIIDLLNLTINKAVTDAKSQEN